MSHVFLSDDWFTAVDALRSEAPEPPAALKDLVINAIVQETPNGDCEIHIKAGQPERGLATDAPTTLTVPYDVAKKLFIDGDQQAAMQAFMAGKIKVAGDMTKLMAMQSVQPTEEQKAFQKKLLDLTV